MNTPYKSYIFEKSLIQGCHKLYSNLSNMQIQQEYTHTVYICLWDIYQLEGVCAPFVFLILVMVGPSWAWLGNVNVVIYTYVLDIYSKQLEDTSQLDIGIGIGYTLPTIGGNKSVGYNYWYWIYPIYIFCQWRENEEMERE